MQAVFKVTNSKGIELVGSFEECSARLKEHFMEPAFRALKPVMTRATEADHQAFLAARNKPAASEPVSQRIEWKAAAAAALAGKASMRIDGEVIGESITPALMPPHRPRRRSEKPMPIELDATRIMWSAGTDELVRKMDRTEVK